MSVMIVTSLGDMVVDLHTERCPLTCKNFLKLCKIKYYNGTLFHTVQKDFTAQTGDPTGTGSGGDSIYKFLYGDQARFFGDEIKLDLKHSKMGTVAMASAGENLNASQFYITLRDDLDYLDGKHTVFGEVAEGIETLSRINEAYVDEKGRPFKNIRIKHTYILDDPFADPPQLVELIPDASPEGKPKDEVDDEVRLEDDWVPMDEQLRPGELEEVLRAKEAHSRAVVLESIGDIPDAEIKPPDNVLFVCKLNPVTEDEDLHTIFSRFGTVTLAEIIRDYKTNDSLCYAFIEFEDKDACEEAYFKMDNALIDDRRIHVDFSQSVSKLWSQYRRKGDQMGKGKGCFKCGSLDHIAKDCTGSPTGNQQPAKYIIKDDSTRHRGDDHSKYEMVFDEDAAQSPRPEKKRGSHEAEDDLERRNNERNEKDYRKRDSIDRHRQSDKFKDSREDDRYRRSRASPPREREKDYRKRNESFNRGLDGNGNRGRRDERDYIKRSGDRDMRGDQRDERDSSKRSGDNDIHGDRREERDSKKLSVDNDIRGDRREDRDSRKRSGEREERDFKKWSVDNDICGDRREERDSKKRSGEKDERNSRKGDADIGIRGDRREERDYKRSADNDVHRRDERDYKKRRGDVDVRGGGQRDERDSKKSADTDLRGDKRDLKKSGDATSLRDHDSDTRRDGRHSHERARRH